MHRLAIIIFLFLFACDMPFKKQEQKEHSEQTLVSNTSLVILGTLQDGGSPHIGCKKDCCKNLFARPDNLRKVVALGIVDQNSKKTFLLEATPDFPSQIQQLQRISGFKNVGVPDAVFLTHAHIGHYTGLMYLGREALGAKGVNVFAMPRMKTYLENNGPWSQLVSLKNIQLQSLEEGKELALSSHIKITAFYVPHRDEYSETVGYKIEGPQKKILFIPDIDKWNKWKRDIVEEIKNVDYAFIDGTFYDGKEINNRDISEIPHPFVVESMELFQTLSKNEKNKIYFIHLNHTNPLLDEESKASKEVRKQGFHVSRINQVFGL